ncbi:MAG: hypothetical protein B7Y43_12695 [Sphingomonas sp. 28-62-20]|uniref:hypothetical protein n=1 Tax=Sphingomonas sp. 28-62-20 TaxID=1970433 RepID=UPI000BCE34C8|nr:MAG: hypothetical protein B7Y43_12695 [Sphingomonas sp. 28-62-20]
MPHHPEAPLQSRRTEITPGSTADEAYAFTHWQNLVDARLIGNIADLSPETCARHAANEAALGVVRATGSVW